LNWDKPAEGTIKIAVAISPAANPKNAPYLLMNPGGPGASGREWITENINSLGTDKLRTHYNLVGFDPRGVGASTAIKCYDTKRTLDFFYNPSPYETGSARDIEFSKKAISDFGAACLKNTGALLGHVDTSSAAKDMDIIRAVLGSKKLNYLGFSYGTLLGSTYAAYFPKNIGQFVLDGVVDPTAKHYVTSQSADDGNSIKFTHASGPNKGKSWKLKIGYLPVKEEFVSEAKKDNFPNFRHQSQPGKTKTASKKSRNYRNSPTTFSGGPAPEKKPVPENGKANTVRINIADEYINEKSKGDEYEYDYGNERF
jgi:pimeloyl-ACP methyl ester carboxylesterase